MDINSFHCMLGEIILYCQIIENDIKMIYAAMHKGDMDRTLEQIEREKWTLGKSIQNLKELDCSDNKNYISKNDYNFLSQMATKRNYWCHQAYVDFIYENNPFNSNAFYTVYQKLQKDNTRLKQVYQSLEKIKLEIMSLYNRK